MVSCMRNVPTVPGTSLMTPFTFPGRGLTLVEADGRGQVVVLCMLKVESPAAELRRYVAP